jgi:hypothetical protein
MSYEDAAETAGVAVGTMKSRVKRAKEDLAAMIEHQKRKSSGKAPISRNYIMARIGSIASRPSTHVAKKGYVGTATLLDRINDNAFGSITVDFTEAFEWGRANGVHARGTRDELLTIINAARFASELPRFMLV